MKHSSRFLTAAYIYDREPFVLRDEDAANLDQLNFSFALIEDGQVSAKHWSGIETYVQYVRRHPHILPVVSVGGWGADGFSQAAGSEETRRRFVSSVVQLMQRYGFLGVDIDWEYPCSSAADIASSPKDKENFTLLIRALRTALDDLEQQDGKRRLLAAAFGAAPQMADDIECAAVGEMLDQVNLMTYDLQTAHVLSHQSPLYGLNDGLPLSAALAVKAYVRAGFPREKIMIGNAMYARLFTAAHQCSLLPASPAADRGSETILYHELCRQPGWLHAYDEHSCAAYAVNGRRYASYDSPLSIAAKGAFVRQNGLMGMMCWEYGGDHNGVLLRAIHDSLNKA